MCPLCYQRGGSLLHCLSTLTRADVCRDLLFGSLHTSARAVYFCCTGLGVTSTGRYPASCPVKPGLSSSAAFRHLQPRLSVLLNTFFNYTIAGGNCPDLSSIPYRNGMGMLPCETPPITLNRPLRLHPRSDRFRPQLLWPAHRTVHSADARHVLLPSEI